MVVVECFAFVVVWELVVRIVLCGCDWGKGLVEWNAGLVIPNWVLHW